MILLDYNLSELTDWVVAMGYPRFRAEQLYNALLNGKGSNDKINLPKDMTDKLSSLAVFQPVVIDKAIESKKQKNIKFLYKLSDGNLIEGMLMQYKFGNTLCVSTQVGCKMNCAFCASGLNGWVRNLSAGEILGQVVAVNRKLGGTVSDRKITNIVLMGMGEPLDNYDNVVKFLRLVTKEGFKFSARNISLSTCGISSKIEKLADENIPVTLCISLHAPNDALRATIMPIARSYSIKSVLDSAKYYYTMTNRRIIIEYTLIDGINDKLKHAKELSEVLGKLPCHVNVIRLNEVPERGLKAPKADACKQFVGFLNRFGVSATTRRTIGDDIDGACGQLRNKNLSPNATRGVSVTTDKPKAKASHNKTDKKPIDTQKSHSNNKQKNKTNTKSYGKTNTRTNNKPVSNNQKRDYKGKGARIGRKGN